MKYNKITDYVLYYLIVFFLATLCIEFTLNSSSSYILIIELISILLVTIIKYYVSSKFPPYSIPIFIPRRLGIGWSVNLKNNHAKYLILLVIFTLLVGFISNVIIY